MARVRRSARGASVAVILAALVATMLPAAGAYASSARDRQRSLEHRIAAKRHQIAMAEAEERKLLSLIKTSDARRAQLTVTLHQIEGQLTAARGQLNSLETKLDSLTVLVAQKNAEIEMTLAQLAAQQKVLDSRVAQIYMSAPVGVSRTIDLASDMNDIVVANAYQASAIARDEQLLGGIKQTEATLESQRAQLAAAQSSIEQSRAQALDQAKRIADAQAQQAAAVQQQSAAIAAKQAAVSKLEAQKKSYIAAMKAMQRESEQIAAFLRAHQHGGGIIHAGNGYFKWPVPDHSISSPFGWRIHPVFHYRSFHTGIDLPNPMGTTVRAARRGTVIFTGDYGPDGTVVMLDHGHGLATLYAHLGRVFVSTGQKVSTLQPLGSVGMTGWTTGPHLHFEVRVRGTAVNPVPWL